MERKLVAFDDKEATEMLAQIAKEDLRSEANTVAWLIRQEFARRYSQPNPVITIEEAVNREV